MTIPQGRWRRTVPLAALSARAAGEGVADVLRRRLQGDRGASLEFHLRNAERYADALSRSKGLLMKVGQILSFVDLSAALDRTYGGVYQAALASLQSDAEPMDPVLVEAVIESELGRGPEELFAEFSPTPLAAASIGQVHAARRHDGTEVAVKVQYPGAVEAVAADLANADLLVGLARNGMRLLGPLAPKADPRSIVEEVLARVLEELDYEHEAANQADFATRSSGLPGVRIPAIVGELCTRRVLVQDLVDGVRRPAACRSGIVPSSGLCRVATRSPRGTREVGIPSSA